HQFFRRHDHHILTNRALGEEGIARNATFDAIVSAKTVAMVGPKAGAHADPRAGRQRGGILHPALGQDALAANDTVVEIELAEARPVARAGEHLARAFRIARGVELDGDTAHAERAE